MSSHPRFHCKNIFRIVQKLNLESIHWTQNIFLYGQCFPDIYTNPLTGNYPVLMNHISLKNYHIVLESHSKIKIISHYVSQGSNHHV